MTLGGNEFEYEGEFAAILELIVDKWLKVQPDQKEVDQQTEKLEQSTHALDTAIQANKPQE